MMQTLSAKKHESLMMQRYHEDCRNWSPYNGGFPCRAFYGFQKAYGYVTFDLKIHTACWRKTKKESIAAFLDLTKTRKDYTP